MLASDSQAGEHALSLVRPTHVEVPDQKTALAIECIGCPCDIFAVR